MKKKVIISVIFVLILNLLYSQNLNDRRVLDRFILGIDNEKSICDKANIDELNIYYEYDGKFEIAVITIKDYFYKSHRCEIVLILIDDKLYSLRYYPITDKMLYKYEDILYSKYNSYTIKQEWFNKHIYIKKDIDANFNESYIHYDIQLMKNYPQYIDISV